MTDDLSRNDMNCAPALAFHPRRVRRLTLEALRLAPSWLNPFLLSGLCALPADARTGALRAGLFQITNIIFVFESLSTLDSTFTSAAKLLGPEFAGLLEDGTPKPPQAAKLW